MTFLFLAPLFLGRSLLPPSCLPILAPIDFLADFIALPTAFLVNILTIVFSTTLPMPPICLVLLSRCGCLTWELPQGTSGPVLCPVVYSRPPPCAGHLDFDDRLADVSFRRVCLPSAVPGVVLYIHLFAPHVLLDDLPLVDDVFADPDLLFGHRLFLDHDLVLDYRHGYLLGPYLGLRRLAACRYPLDAYLLATGRHLHALSVVADALADLHAAGHALAGPR